MFQEQSVPVTLATICEGALEEQFQALYPAIVAKLTADNKASVGITISFQRLKDTSTMVNASFKITPRFPASSKASICQITDGGKLKTDAAPEKKNNVKQLNLVSGGNE